MSPGNDNDGDGAGLDDLFPELASPPRGRRVDPGKAALLALQPPENRAAVEQYFAGRERGRAGGKAASLSGKAGESWVETHHRRAVEAGLVARIDHVGPPTQTHVVNGKAQRDARGRHVVVCVGVAPPDYLGCLADGRMLAVEAKRRHGRLHAPLSDDELAEHVEDLAALERHQAEYLADVARHGAVALVVCAFVRRHQGREHEVRVAVPWRELGDRWRSPKGGRISVGPEDLDDWIADPDCYLRRFCAA